MARQKHSVAPCMAARQGQSTAAAAADMASLMRHPSRRGGAAAPHITAWGCSATHHTRGRHATPTRLVLLLLWLHIKPVWPYGLAMVEQARRRRAYRDMWVMWHHGSAGFLIVTWHTQWHLPLGLWLAFWLCTWRSAIVTCTVLESSSQSLLNFFHK